jgi:hypothetical protein
MKVAIYARYSSDNQRDASIADQMRVCRAFAERQGWTIYLFSGLTKCGVCGAGFIMSSKNRLGCFGARDQGRCDNHLTTRRDEVEARGASWPYRRHRPDAEPGRLQIELKGNLAAMLGAATNAKRSPETGDLSLQVVMVAGAGFEPATFGL